MSITILATNSDAVVGLLGFGAFFCAVVAVFRDYFKAFSSRSLEEPTPLSPYIPYELDLAQRSVSLLLLVVVFASLCFILIYIISNSLSLFIIGFMFLFISTVLVTIGTIILEFWIIYAHRKETETTKHIEAKAEQLFQEDLEKLEKETG